MSTIPPSTPINSERLTLVPLTPAFLSASLAGDASTAGALAGLAVPPEWFAERPLIEMRLGDLQADPAYQPWGLRAVAERASGMMVGYIGFHTRPGPAYLSDLAPGGMEMGYTIFPAFRRRGYAREAVEALISWAASQGVRRFVLSIRPDNAPSQAIAARLGFRKVDEHMDEEDGLEEVFRLDVDGVGGELAPERG